jgi:hypothetical protein
VRAARALVYGGTSSARVSRAHAPTRYLDRVCARACARITHKRARRADVHADTRMHERGNLLSLLAFARLPPATHCRARALQTRSRLRPPSVARTRAHAGARHTRTHTYISFSFSRSLSQTLSLTPSPSPFPSLSHTHMHTHTHTTLARGAHLHNQAAHVRLLCRQQDHRECTRVLYCCKFGILAP